MKISFRYFNLFFWIIKLLDEIDWMKDVRCSLKDLRTHMPEDVKHEQDKSHLHELIYHIDRVVSECERGLAVEVVDNGFT